MTQTQINTSQKLVEVMKNKKMAKKAPNLFIGGVFQKYIWKIAFIKNLGFFSKFITINTIK